MNKVLYICVLILSLFLCNGCVGKLSGEYKVFTNKDEEAETDRIINIVANAIKNKDTDSLLVEFSEYTKDRHNIEEQLEKAMAFIDGNIVEIQEKYAGITGTAYYSAYGETELYYSGKLYGVKTDKGKSYTVIISGTFHYRDKPDYIGLDYICIRNDNEKDEAKHECVVGE